MENLVNYLLVYVIGNILFYILYLGLLGFFAYSNKNYKLPSKFSKWTMFLMVFFPLFSLWACASMIYRMIIISRFKKTNGTLYEQAIHILNLFEKGYITLPVYLEYWGRIYDQCNQINLLNKKTKGS